MGIRMDQFEGLNSHALAFLEQNEIPQEVCEYCKRPFPRDLKIIGHFRGMFDQEYPLNRHQLTDGGYADEFLQAAPWSSGPIFFLSLRRNDGLEFKWSEKEIEEKSGYILGDD